MLLFSVFILWFAIVHEENQLYLSAGLGASYLIWGYSFIYSTPFHWYYKIVETIYFTWFIGISTYLFYIEQVWVMALFLLPHVIHYSFWGRKHEETALHYMLLEIEEKKDLHQIEIFKHEIKKRPYSVFFRHWHSSVIKIEKTIKEEKDKTE